MADPVARLAALASVDLRAAVKRTARSSALYGVAGVLVATAYTVGIVALAVLLSGWLGPVAALSLIALAALGLAAGLVAVVQARNREARQKERARANLRRLAITSALAVLPARLVRSPLALLAALGLGFGLARLFLDPPDDKT